MKKVLNRTLSKIKKEHILIGLLVLSAIALRFYNLSEWYFFNVDEDWYSFLVHKVAVDHRPALVGWEIPGGLISPPIMIYFGALVSLLSFGNPLGLAVTAVLFGVLGVFLVYLVGKNLFRTEIGLIAAFIYAFSYFITIYNRLSINLLFGPLLTLIAYLSLKKIADGDKRFFYLLSVVWMFTVQEGSMLSVVLLSIIVLFFIKKTFKIKDLVFPLGLFLLSFLPLLIFELRHNFFVAREFVEFFSKPSGNSFDIGHFLNAIDVMLRAFTRVFLPNGPNDINVQILPCKQYLEMVTNSSSWLYPFFAIIFFAIFAFLVFRKQTFGYKIISLHLLVVLFGLFVYSLINPGYLHEWFFNVITPTFVLVMGIVFWQLYKMHYGKFMVGIILAAFLVANVYFTITGTAIVGYQDKLNAVSYAVQKVGDEPFSVNILGNGCNGQGYIYLFTYLGKEPSYSYMDNKYENWLYPPKEKTLVTRQVLLVPIVDLETQKQKQEYSKFEKAAISKKRFDNLEVLILPADSYRQLN